MVIPTLTFLEGESLLALSETPAVTIQSVVLQVVLEPSTLRVQTILLAESFERTGEKFVLQQQRHLP